MMSDLLLGHQCRRWSQLTGNFNGVRVNKFDRVLDCDDVLVVVLTDPIKYRNQRGGLARTCRTHNEAKTLLLRDLLTNELDNSRRETNFFERSDSVRDKPDGNPDPLMGEMGLNAEPSYAQRTT